MEQNFENLKNEILRRAKEANACTEQYKRAYQAETTAELLQVVKDNFDWAVRYSVIDVALIEQHQTVFNANNIWANVNVTSGYLIANGNATVTACNSATVYAYNSATVTAYNNATVTAYNSATVYAYNSATVYAYGNATVTACNSATVYAYDNATVEANDNAYITSHYTVECKLSDNAIYRIQETNTIRYASNDIKLEKVNQE